MTPEELLTALRECDVQVAHHPKTGGYSKELVDWHIVTTSITSVMLIEGDPETIRKIEAMLKGGA